MKDGVGGLPKSGIGSTLGNSSNIKYLSETDYIFGLKNKLQIYTFQRTLKIYRSSRYVFFWVLVLKGAQAWNFLLLGFS
jgi:hypothetical protein